MTINYNSIPVADPSHNPDAAKLFDKIRADMNELIEKIRLNSRDGATVDLNAAIEEAYLRALIVSGVLTPFPENVALIVPAQNSVH